jgi:type III secretion system (T3SS) SseB-like protein
MEALSELESLLAEASHEPASEERLRLLLLDSELYALGEEEPDGEGVRLVQHTLRDTTYLSAYTSRERVEAVAPGESYVALPGGAILSALEPGVRLVINLGSWPNRTIEHEEAAALVLEWGPRLRQPERYPAGLLETLWAHFCRLGSVLEAHLAELLEAGQSSYLVVAFRTAEGDGGPVAEEAQRLAAALHGIDVRFYQVGEDGFSRQLLEAGVCFFDRGHLTVDIDDITRCDVLRAG